MRPLLFSLALLFAACSDTEPRPPPSDRFVFPSGLVYRPGSVTGTTNGVLYVSSANFDRCFDLGTVMAVDLDRVGAEGQGLKPLGTYTDDDDLPVTLANLNIAPGSRVYIQSYAGEMALKEGATPRLFVPTRADGNYVHYIDITAPAQLRCVGKDGNPDAERDNCTDEVLSPLSLTSGIPGQFSDLPRAPAPFGVSLDPSGSLWVTHLNPADSPELSNDDYASYVVKLRTDVPLVENTDFFPLDIPGLPQGGSNSVVADERYVFVSGRISPGITSPTATRRFLVRVVDNRNTGEPKLSPQDSGLDLGFAAQDARGLALTPKVVGAESAPRRLYVATRAPDSLVTVNVTGIEPTSDTPSLNVVGAVPVPNGPTQVVLVPRGTSPSGVTRSELVLVSCSDAGVLAIYDPDVGQVVAQVLVGETSGTTQPQPFGLAVQQQGNAARVFVSNFGDGRISVVDIADLENPQLARLVAHLGARQDQASACTEVQE